MVQKQISPDPVVSCEAVQLHLRAAHPEGEVGVRLALHLVPVVVKVFPSAEEQRRQLWPAALFRTDQQQQRSDVPEEAGGW